MIFNYFKNIGTYRTKKPTDYGSPLWREHYEEWCQYRRDRQTVFNVLVTPLVSMAIVATVYSLLCIPLMWAVPLFGLWMLVTAAGANLWVYKRLTVRGCYGLSGRGDK